MGSLCSKSSTHEGGHTVLSSGPNSPANANSGAAASRPSNPRLAAAEAAERRLQAAQRRGTNEANPQRGKLAGQLAKQNSSKLVPEAQQPERLVWD
ncbi:hypothetical protein CPB84DRAFT_1799897 [Gymnopilus junonius]|uniref:Uncharacterized protein n=1 Tax=Gymnopilus junonius TaxID=109634 RepID=A0A9P5TGI2_GYMJU|nr:hypothetical protein CPB84DRAFT_1799897 [Gymnopilus junonius]